MQKWLKSGLTGVFGLFLSVSVTQNASAVCEKIRVSYTTNWIPVAYDSSNGEPSGIAIQLHREIFKRLNIPVEFVSGLPWRRQMQMLDHGEIDAIAAIHHNPERAERLALTDAFTESIVHVYRTKETSLRYSTLEDLKQYTGVLIKDASYGKEFDSYRRENLAILEFTELSRIMELLLKRRADYMILPTNISDFMIQNYGGEGEVIKSGPPVLVQPIHMGFSRKSSCRFMVEAVNEQITSMKRDGLINRLELTKYTN